MSERRVRLPIHLIIIEAQVPLMTPSFNMMVYHIINCKLQVEAADARGLFVYTNPVPSGIRPDMEDPIMEEAGQYHRRESQL